jgi:hypothetical protein
MTEQNQDQDQIQEPTITSAAAYRKMMQEQIKVVTLPSNASFKIRKLSLMDFLATVVVPSGLIKDEDLKDWRSKTDEERMAITKKNLTPDMNEKMIRLLIVSSLVEPKVVDGVEPGDDELTVEEVTKDSMDSVALVHEILTFNGLDKGFVAGVRPFRGE